MSFTENYRIMFHMMTQVTDPIIPYPRITPTPYALSSPLQLIYPLMTPTTHRPTRHPCNKHSLKMHPLSLSYDDNVGPSAAGPHLE